MKTLLTLLLTLTITMTFAQRKYSPFYAQDYAEYHTPKWWTKKGIALGISFLGGVSNGYHEVIDHHYYVFEEVHPNHNAQWWGPGSWTNKWALDGDGKLIPNERDLFFSPHSKERFPFSSSLLVFVTDADHFFEFGNHTCLMVAPPVSLYKTEPHPKDWHYLAEFGLHFLARSLGMWLVYDVIYRPKIH